mgnify:CR=1 FL=1
MFTSLELLTISFVAVGLAADAVAVSLTSGLMIRHIHVNKALKIALFFGGFQAIIAGGTARAWSRPHNAKMLMVAARSSAHVHCKLESSSTSSVQRVFRRCGQRAN